MKAKPTSVWKPATDDEIRVNSNNCYLENSYLPTDQIMKCARKCTYEKIGIFDETSGFNVENIIKSEMLKGFSEDDSKAMTKKCAVKKEESETDCEWASRGGDCFKAEELSRIRSITETKREIEI